MKSIHEWKLEKYFELQSLGGPDQSLGDQSLGDQSLGSRDTRPLSAMLGKSMLQGGGSSKKINQQIAARLVRNNLVDDLLEIGGEQGLDAFDTFLDAANALAKIIITGSRSGNISRSSYDKLNRLHGAGEEQ